MSGPELKRPRIFWFELVQKRAIRTPPPADAAKEKLFVAAVRQQCGGVFHQGAQAWLVPEDAMEAAKQLVGQYYRHYQFVDRPQPDPQPEERPLRREEPPAARPRAQHRSPYEAFCELVGWDDPGCLSFARARLLYRRAAIRSHPDVGGSWDQMASLNVAWRAISGHDRSPPCRIRC